MKTRLIRILFVIFISLSFNVTAQVGIETIFPNALLDIRAVDATNPNSTDGILMPRVNKLVFDLTPSQNGVLVYLNQKFTAASSNGGGVYDVGLQQWNGDLRSGAGDWVFLAPSTRKTTAIHTWNKNNIVEKSLTTMGCLSVKFGYNSGNTIDIYIRSNCGSQTQAHYSFVQGWNTFVFGSVRTDSFRGRFNLVANEWKMIHNLDFDNDEMIFGYLHFPNSNKIYDMVISGQDGSGFNANEANIILSIEEL